MGQHMFAFGTKEIKIIISTLLAIVMLMTGCIFDGMSDDKYVSQICEKLDNQTEFYLSEVFEFDFDKAYVIPQMYSKQASLLNLYNLETKVEIDEITNDIYRRILFIKDNAVIYDFVYSTTDLFTENKDLIVYPNTKIISTECKIKTKGCRGFIFSGNLTEGIIQNNNE